MPNNLDAIVSGWKAHFASADRDIEWLDAERPAHAWLHEGLLLVGVIDAIGRTSTGELFFGEWKTANPREKKTWKQVWRKNPQSLTYGVLMDYSPSIWPGCSRFTVRKAFKENVPTFDHAWYKYSASELAHWSRELCGIASEIKEYVREGLKPWPTNFSRCFRYGMDYRCAYFDAGCNLEQWDMVPAEALGRVGSPAISLPTGPDAALARAAEELAFHPNRKDVVVLSASQVADWLDCRELFRKNSMEGVKMPPGEALQLGSDFHHQIGEHYKSLIKPREHQESLADA